MISRLENNFVRLLAAFTLLISWNLAYLFLPHEWESLTAFIGIPVTLLMPGLFSVFILGAKRLSRLVLVFSVGISVFLLMLVALGGNFLPLLVGRSRPLDTPMLYWLFNLVYVVLAVLAALRYEAPIRSPGGKSNRRGPVNAIVALMAAVVLVLAVMGAITLDNGGTNALSLSALFGMLITVPATYLLRKHLRTRTILWTIATTTMALLLATSLRSWYASGQDLQHEYQVFNLALTQGKWDPKAYSDPYNACLSITLLPVALSKLLRVDGVIVFKLFSQLIFVTVPLTIYVISEQFLGRGKAFIGSILFIGLPTFSIDVPLISRQEIAFVFVALALAAMFVRREEWLVRHRQTVFATMAVGVIVSHYSTAYIFVASVTLTFLLSRFYSLIRRQSRSKVASTYRMATPAVITIAVTAYLWLDLATKATSDLQRKLAGSASSAAQLFKNPGTVIAGLGTPNGGSTTDNLRVYVKDTAVNPHANINAITHSLTVVSTDVPPTTLSHWLQANVGIDAPRMVSELYYNFATPFYLLFILIGTLLLLSPRIRTKVGNIPELYIIWCISAEVILGAEILLPGLDQEYGISRAFLQAFIVLGLPMVAGIGAALGKWKRVSSCLLLIIGTGLLVLYSGLLPYLTGGLHRQLSLGNSGQYYGTIYPHTSDLAAYNWIQGNIPLGSKINVADFAAVLAYHPLFPFNVTSAGVFPFQVKTGNYVLLSDSQTADHVVYSFDQLIPLRFNPNIYNKDDLLYSAGGTQLYRKN